MAANTRNELTKFTFEHSQIEQLPQKAEITVLLFLIMFRVFVLLLLLLFLGQRSQFHFDICVCCCYWWSLYRYCCATAAEAATTTTTTTAAAAAEHEFQRLRQRCSRQRFSFSLPFPRSLCRAVSLLGDALGSENLHFICGRRASSVPGKHHILLHSCMGSPDWHRLRVDYTD